jgi:hypothetical protein
MDYLTQYYKNLCESLQQRLDSMSSFRRTMDSAFREPSLNVSNISVPEPRRDYRDVAREAQRAVQQRGTTIPGMPKLSANIRFSKMTREGIPVDDENLSPEERQQAQRSTGLTPQSDLYAFGQLTPEERRTVAPGLPTAVLKGMEQEQAQTSRSAVAYGKGDRKLGADKVDVLNVVSQTLEDRKGPLGGKAGAQSYVDRLNRNSATGNQVNTNMALYGKSYKELTAMRDALDQEIRAGFASGNKTIDPTKRKTLMDLNKAIDTSLESDIKRNF